MSVLATAGDKFSASVELVTKSCQNCGTVFAIPSGMYRRFNENGAAIRCPNAECSWPSFTRTESDVDKWKRQASENLQSKRYWRNEAELNDRRRRAQKAQTTIARNKIKRTEAGLCPHCNRNFKQLRRHMKSQHTGEPNAKDT